MRSWLAMKKALTAMDLVMRQWARVLGLDECGVMVLMLMGGGAQVAACDLAKECGRARQQVQRSLRLMQHRGWVEPAAMSAKGRVQAWALTGRGQLLWCCLDSATVLWSELFERHVELAQVTASLEQMVGTMVNRPCADGWGLLVPSALREELMRGQLAMEEALLAEREVAEPTHPGPPHWTAEEYAQVERSWAALWR